MKQLPPPRKRKLQQHKHTVLLLFLTLTMANSWSVPMNTPALSNSGKRMMNGNGRLYVHVHVTPSSLPFTARPLRIRSEEPILLQLQLQRMNMDSYPADEDGDGSDDFDMVQQASTSSLDEGAPPQVMMNQHDSNTDKNEEEESQQQVDTAKTRTTQQQEQQQYSEDIEALRRKQRQKRRARRRRYSNERISRKDRTIPSSSNHNKNDDNDIFDEFDSEEWDGRSLLPLVQKSAQTVKQRGRDVARVAGDAVGRWIPIPLDGLDEDARTNRNGTWRRRIRRWRGTDPTNTNSNANTKIVEDEDGVWEVDWYYVSKDDNENRRRRERPLNDWDDEWRNSSSSKRRRPRSSRREVVRNNDNGGNYNSRRGRPSGAREPIQTRQRRVRVDGTRTSTATTRTRTKTNRPAPKSDHPNRMPSLLLPPTLEGTAYFPSMDRDATGRRTSGNRNNDVDADSTVSESKRNSSSETKKNRTANINSQVDGLDDRHATTTMKKTHIPNQKETRENCDDDDDDDATNIHTKRTKTQTQMNRRRDNHKRNPNNENKKIYSVYPLDDEDDNDLEIFYGKTAAKAINTVGDFIADVVAEGKIPGFDDKKTYSGDDKNYDDNDAKKHNNTQTRQGTTKGKHASSFNNPPSKRRTKRKYWRDRLSERVDYALGLHEDGNYYKRWQEQLERDKEEIDAHGGGGNDPVSIFYGRQRKDKQNGGKLKKKKKKKKKKKGYNVPFWEEDGTLVSLIFGRTPSGEKLTLDKLFQKEISVNICTSTFRSVFRSIVFLISNLSRWASCRGALPQPIVVFFLFAAAITAPSKRRFTTVGVTLVALRTAAEALHGYIYGNEDWDDDRMYIDDGHDDLDDDCDDDEEEEKESCDDDGWEGDGL